MKKWFIAVSIIAVLMLGVTAFAHSAPPKIQINGAGVFSDANYVKSNKAYVDVAAYFNTLKQSYSVSKDKKSITVFGKKVSVSSNKGKLVANLDTLAKAAKGERVTYFPKEGLFYVLDVPDGVVKITPAVPKMGEHWARPGTDLPTGPIYGVYKGKLVFIEQMLEQKFFIEGKSLTNIEGMRGLPSPSVVQTDIEFQPNGHEGFMVPHYDIHHYFISDKEQQAIMGDMVH